MDELINEILEAIGLEKIKANPMVDKVGYNPHEVKGMKEIIDIIINGDKK